MDLIIKEYYKDYIFFLCSDGLYNMLKEFEIKDVFIKEEDIQKACETLATMANNRGGYDNITIVAIKFN